MTHPPLATPTRRGLRGRFIAPFAEFARTGALGGIALMAAMVVALAWANSPWSHGYHALWERPISVGWTDAPLTMSLHQWINDALMVVFFLVVGLEIKRELLVGELAQPRQAALPIAAALGGMIVPALVYAAVNSGGRARGAGGSPWPPTSPSPWVCWRCSAPASRWASRSS